MKTRKLIKCKLSHLSGVIVGGSISLLLVTGSACAEDEKQKVLVSGVLEENWDDIEMRFVRYRRVLNATAEDVGRSFERPSDVVNRPLRDERLLQTDTNIFVVHSIHFLANTDRIPPHAKLDPYIGRGGQTRRIYQFTSAPTDIPLSERILEGGYTSDDLLRQFKWLRLIRPLRLSEIAADGSVTVDYAGRTYLLSPGSEQTLSDQTEYRPAQQFLENKPDLTRKEKSLLAAGTEALAEKRIVAKNPIPGEQSLQGKQFYVRTKVTLINFGYKRY